MKIHRWADVKASRARSPEQEAKIAEWVKAAKAAVPLKELRATCGLTQAELAERVEMTRAQISRLERSSPRVETLRRYVEGLGAELHIVVRLDGHHYELRL